MKAHNLVVRIAGLQSELIRVDLDFSIITIILTIVICRFISKIFGM